MQLAHTLQPSSPQTPSPRHVLIGGGSGFIGRALTRVLEARGDRVTIVSRTAGAPGEQRITWDDLEAKGLPDCDVVINLAGKHILDMRRRWSAAYRDEVLSSRILTTQALVRAINAKTNPPEVFISTAGKCFYGSQAFRSTEQYFDLDERSDPIGVDYPAQLVSQWEAAADDIDASRVRHVKLRLGIVLAGAAGNQPQPKKAGANGIFPLLHGIFKRGLCFSMGTGVQPFPWVHIDDAVGITLRAIDNPALSGIFNVVSPGIVSNQQFSEQLALRVGRRLLGHIPAAVIKAVIGIERSTILLLGQRVRPNRTIEHGYRFAYPNIGPALDDLVRSTQAGS